MRDLTGQRGTAERGNDPKGLAFEIADLLLVQAWADFHEIRIVTRLDHGAADEEFEEVIEIETCAGGLWRLLMWRDRQAVFLQPVVGVMRRYASVIEALHGVRGKEAVTLTDITAAGWPVV